LFLLRGRRSVEVELTHREELEDAVLHVVEPVVVLLQDLLRERQIDLLFGALVPRQLGHPLEERADDLVFGRLRARALQALELTIDLGALILGELEGLDALTHLLDVVAFLLFAELLLDRLELLTEQHLALPLAELRLHLGLDVLLRIDARELALDREEAFAHTLLVVEQLEQTLLLGRLQLEVERDQVGERTRLFDALDQLVESFGGYAAACSQLGRAIAELAVERLERRILGLLRLPALHLQEHGVQHGLPLGVVGERLRAPLALHEQLHAATHSVRLDDADDRADRVQILGRGVVHVLALRDREEAPIAVERFLHGLHGARSAGRDRHGDPGIHDGIAQGKHGKGESLGHRRRSLLGW
jgi:hypothetical protein